MAKRSKRTVGKKKTLPGEQNEWDSRHRQTERILACLGGRKQHLQRVKGCSLDVLGQLVAGWLLHGTLDRSLPQRFHLPPTTHATGSCGNTCIEGFDRYISSRDGKDSRKESHIDQAKNVASSFSAFIHSSSTCNFKSSW